MNDEPQPQPSHVETWTAPYDGLYKVLRINGVSEVKRWACPCMANCHNYALYGVGTSEIADPGRPVTRYVWVVMSSGNPPGMIIIRGVSEADTNLNRLWSAKPCKVIGAAIAPSQHHEWLWSHTVLAYLIMGLHVEIHAELNLLKAN